MRITVLSKGLEEAAHQLFIDDKEAVGCEIFLVPNSLLSAS